MCRALIKKFIKSFATMLLNIFNKFKIDFPLTMPSLNKAYLTVLLSSFKYSLF